MKIEPRIRIDQLYGKLSKDLRWEITNKFYWELWRQLRNPMKAQFSELYKLWWQLKEDLNE